MAMLAERKKKQKWSADPRNTNWSNDTSRFGYQMLSKMGWDSGKGLGAKEDGMTAFIKTVKRKHNLGFGAEKSNEDNWLSHQLAFDDLLSQLNQHSENETEEDRPKKKKKKYELEKTARQSRKRVFYNKFIRSKDLSSKSAEDMACVFGRRSKSDPVTPQELSEDEESDLSTTSCSPRGLHGVQTITSGQNIQEYFQKKMMEIKAARERKEKEETVSTGKEESTDVDTGNHKNLGHGDGICEKKKIDKKRKRRIEVEKEDSESAEKSCDFGEDACREKEIMLTNMTLEGDRQSRDQEIRNKERKKKKRTELNRDIDLELDDVSVVSPEMRGAVSVVTTEIDELNDVECELARDCSKVEGRRDKKKKKYKNSLLSSEEQRLADNSVKKKKKKNKKKIKLLSE
ncbi:PIN2/TERF1-interacting telomerase inhibitor 1-like isoform X1 [Acropora millepora]|uniref:PIN2/TERF1-interacting telomerase inhibitor 1-like isoform X1 n=1 Tax=Acropora millepora TaxID=45264 RepID=UPI001CF41BCF|nr:PIN2/TERF1-interacting telomerase inhibitor 1-like isoform X1 [Acropora millepora]